VPRQDAGGQWYIVVTLIETRGEGGIFLCDPTPGYRVTQGDLCDPPVLSEDERDILLGCAWELNEHLPHVVDGPRVSAAVGQGNGLSADNSHNGQVSAEKSHSRPMSADNTHPGAPSADHAERPGDDFNSRGDVRAVLQKHGWALARGGENEYWRRPGKPHGWSATLKGRVFYVFSSNAAPFEPNKAYSPFAVYTLLEHGGDFEQAARALRQLGYGSAPSDHGVDISPLVAMSTDNGDSPPENTDIPDPGPLPEEMLLVPGFVGEVMEHCLETAPYPNPVMAFSGALALLAFLAGRRVRDPGDNRTNIYLLGLAHSAAGKDWPRKINTRIVHEVGLADCLGERFASGEGIQDALFQTPSMLFQTDEIDGMLQSINKAKDARHESIMSTLLTLYSASNSVFPMRRKAGKESPGVIDQPCLVIFGTAIPNHYYEALSRRMLTNGFFARMLILEAGQRRKGQEPTIRDLPPRVVETARWWADQRVPARGSNLLGIHPEARIVEHTDEARRLLVKTRQEADAEYEKAAKANDTVGTTVWGRVSEQVRKLALLSAISLDREATHIGVDAVQWASGFVMHQTRRMLFMAASHVAENPFHAECLKLMQTLREAPDHTMQRQHLLRAMRCKAAEFDQIVGTLFQQGDIVPVDIPTRTKTALGYRLA